MSIQKKAIRAVLNLFYPKPYLYAQDAMWRLAEDARLDGDEAGAQRLLQMKRQYEDDTVSRWEAKQQERTKVIQWLMNVLLVGAVTVYCLIKTLTE